MSTKIIPDPAGDRQHEAGLDLARRRAVYEQRERVIRAEWMLRDLDRIHFLFVERFGIDLNSSWDVRHTARTDRVPARVDVEFLDGDLQVVSRSTWAIAFLSKELVVALHCYRCQQDDWSEPMMTVAEAVIQMTRLGHRCVVCR